MEKAFGLEIPENLDDACELNRTALLVYDMQIGIFSQLQQFAIASATPLRSGLASPSAL